MVSIVVPVYNRPKLIKELVQSVLIQTSSNWELIIVDDGSQDDTFDVASNLSSKDNRIRSFQRPKNKLKGPSSCRNFGAKKAKGEYIVFFDSDDLFFPWCIEELTKKMNVNKKIECGVFQQVSYQKGFEQNMWWRAVNDNVDGYINRFVTFQFSFSTHSVIWRTKSFLKSPGWPEDLGVWEDPFLHIQCMKKGVTFSWLGGDPMGVIRMGSAENQITSHSDLRSYIHLTSDLKKILNDEEIKLWHNTVLSKAIHIMIQEDNKNNLNDTWKLFRKHLQLSKLKKLLLPLYLTLNRFLKKIPGIRGVVYRLSYLFRDKIDTFAPQYLNDFDLKELKTKINQLDTTTKSKIIDIANLKL